MTVGELIKELENFDEDLEVMDCGFLAFNYVEQDILRDEYKINPDKEVVIIY